ncbi:MAG TPA: hypothetical protein VIV65_12270, partial [Gemmatimonadaceae bacterium]
MRPVSDRVADARRAIREAVNHFHGGVAVGQIADNFLSAIKRKCGFVDVHFRLLNGIDWTIVEDLGRDGEMGPITSPMVIALRDASLHLRHPSAVVDHAYMAFDGLTSGIVNVGDTLARLLNAVYGPPGGFKIQQERATLLSIVGKCRAASGVGQALGAPALDWLKSLRKLRGECQHAAVETVLLKRNLADAG